MAKFVFRLDPLLKARRRQEETEQRAMAELLRQRMALEDMLRQYQQRITHGKESLRGALAGALDMRALRLEAGASLHLVRKAQQVVLQLAGLGQRQEAVRTRLIVGSLTVSVGITLSGGGGGEDLNLVVTNTPAIDVKVLRRVVKF